MFGDEEEEDWKREELTFHTALEEVSPCPDLVASENLALA